MKLYAASDMWHAAMHQSLHEDTCKASAEINSAHLSRLQWGRPGNNSTEHESLPVSNLHLAPLNMAMTLKLTLQILQVPFMIH